MKKMVGLILTVIAVLSGCAQDSGSDDQVVPVLAHPVTDTEKPNICLIGDSRVAMFPVKLFTEYDVFDYGVGGTTTDENVEILSAIAETGVQFDAVIVSVGVNDYMGGNTVSESAANLAECMALANSLSGRVFITTIPGCCTGGDLPINSVVAITKNTALINARIPAIGSQIIPLAETLCTDGYLKAEYNLDGIHYNAAGYDAVYALYMSYLKGTK